VGVICFCLASRGLVGFTYGGDMTNSTAPIFMETIDKLGAGHLFGLAEESKPSLTGALSAGAGPTGALSTGALGTRSLSAGLLSTGPSMGLASTGSLSTGSSSPGSSPTGTSPNGMSPNGTSSAGTAYAESRAETTERLRLVAARSGEPADLRDYLTALATAVPAMSPDNCRLVAGLLGVGVAPAFREGGPIREP
jgi:hypothetical protein